MNSVVNENGDLNLNVIYNGDCLDLMKNIPEKSIDMILCDLPYGATKNAWDSVIDLDEMWNQYLRIIKDNGCIALTASQPFASLLVTSNLKYFRYDWIWKKNKSTGFLNAKKMPLRNHESILIFYKNLPTYNPQKTQGHSPVNSYCKNTSDGTNYGKTKLGISGGGQTDRYPLSIQEFSVVNNDNSHGNKSHPTQKPVELFEYLIRTYTNAGDIVLDNCCGSGTTGIAAINSGRNYILIEKNIEYFNMADNRLRSYTHNSQIWT